jgi:hemolysin-activating ACP:hemolysin acyltransferase
MEALGLVLSFVCRATPYAEFRASKIIKAVQHQLSTGCHVCLTEDDQLIAYAGWLMIDRQDGENWLADKATLRPASSLKTGAAALTIVSTTSSRQISSLIRACRKLAPQTTIYFKRDYSGRRSRKSKVQNT